MKDTEKRPKSLLINEELLKRFQKLQYQDYCTLQTLFEKYIFSLSSEDWKLIILEFENVIKRCNEINYQDYATAIAYAIWHFLNRYHRFQIMLKDLLCKGYLNRYKNHKHDVLDVGTGPAQTLFALSDYFSELNILDGKISFLLNPEYVEQSDGFRRFLHMFVELALLKEKQYLVPFHNAKSNNAFDIPYDEINWYGRNRYYITKSRYDIVVFNNFLTSPEFTKAYKKQLRLTWKYLRNNGLLIVIGASDQDPKYAKVYNIIRNTVLKKFNDEAFHGYCTVVEDQEFCYRYDDEIGEELRKHYERIISFLKEKPLGEKEEGVLWDLVSKDDRRRMENIIMQTSEKTEKENWSGIKWKVVVYQKHSFYKKKAEKPDKRIYGNYCSLNDDFWRKQIEKAIISAE